MASARDWSWRALSLLATLAAVGLLVTVLAWWGWRAFGPPPLSIPVAAAPDPVATILASGLFAATGAVPPAAVPAKDEALQSLGDARLLGIVAEADGTGYAVFKLATGTRIVRAGQDIAQGAHLIAVRPDGVTIRDGDAERRILLRAAVAPAPVKAGTALMKSSARPSACTLPAGFTGAVLRLNSELFQGIINRPESWTSLVVPDNGALAVRGDSGFVTMLAMKKGDRLEQANGVALTVADDVVSAVLKPLAASQQVRISGKREGAAREWLLLNAGTCPA